MFACFPIVLRIYVKSSFSTFSKARKKCVQEEFARNGILEIFEKSFDFDYALIFGQKSTFDDFCSCACRTSVIGLSNFGKLAVLAKISFAQVFFGGKKESSRLPVTLLVWSVIVFQEYLEDNLNS